MQMKLVTDFGIVGSLLLQGWFRDTCKWFYLMPIEASTYFNAKQLVLSNRISSRFMNDRNCNHCSRKQGACFYHRFYHCCASAPPAVFFAGLEEMGFCPLHLISILLSLWRNSYSIRPKTHYFQMLTIMQAVLVSLEDLWHLGPPPDTSLSSLFCRQASLKMPTYSPVVTTSAIRT